MLGGLDFTLQGSAPIVGFVGACVYITSYALMQTGVVRGQSQTYASLVIVSAACVAYSATNPWNVAVFIMQMFYVGISLVGITRIVVNRRMLGCSEEERAFIRTHLPELRPEHARPLMRIAEWRDMDAGTVLTREGERFEALYHLVRGEAEVEIDGRIVGTSSDCFIGEMTFLAGAPATATVTLRTPGRILVFEAARLRRFLRKRPEVKLAVTAGFAGSTKALLMRRNREAFGPAERTPREGDPLERVAEMEGNEL